MLWLGDADVLFFGGASAASSFEVFTTVAALSMVVVSLPNVVFGADGEAVGAADVGRLVAGIFAAVGFPVGASVGGRLLTVGAGSGDDISEAFFGALGGEESSDMFLLIIGRGSLVLGKLADE